MVLQAQSVSDSFARDACALASMSWWAFGGLMGIFRVYMDYIGRILWGVIWENGGFCIKKGCRKTCVGCRGEWKHGSYCLGSRV